MGKRSLKVRLMKTQGMQSRRSLRSSLLFTGTTLLRLEPEVVVPAGSELNSACHNCHKTIMFVSLKPCSGCNVVHYCSGACKKADEALHQEECKHLAALSVKYYGSASMAKGQKPVIPGPKVRMAARLLWKRRLLGDKWWKAMEALWSIPANHRERHKEDDMKYSLEQEDVSNDVLLLALLLCGSSKDLQAKRTELGLTGEHDLQLLHNRTTDNAIIVPHVDLSPRAEVLSTTAALINHSCEPNVLIVFPHGPGVKKCLHVVAVKDIEAGQELLTSYVDTSQPFLFRQVTLMQKYDLICDCSACLEGRAMLSKGEGNEHFGLRSQEKIDEQGGQLDPREVVHCGRSNCDGWVSVQWDPIKPKGLCTKCNQPCILDESKLKEDLNYAEAYFYQFEKTKSEFQSVVHLSDWQADSQ